MTLRPRSPGVQTCLRRLDALVGINFKILVDFIIPSFRDCINVILVHIQPHLCYMTDFYTTTFTSHTHLSSQKQNISFILKERYSYDGCQLNGFTYFLSFNHPFKQDTNQVQSGPKCRRFNLTSSRSFHHNAAAHYTVYCHLLCMPL